jgi:hypothetical protein
MDFKPNNTNALSALIVAPIAGKATLFGTIINIDVQTKQ